MARTPARRRRFSRGRGGGGRPRRVWARGSHFELDLAGTPVGIDLLADYKTRRGVEALNAVTVGPIRGRITCFQTLGTGNAPGVRRIHTVGLGIVLASRTPIDPADWRPDAAVNYHLDWLWYHECHLMEDVRRSTTGDFVDSSGATDQIELDIRSMRRMEELDQKLFFFAGANTVTQSTANLMAQFSVLLRGDGL